MKRLYEVRVLATGEIFTGPELAEDACEFWLRAIGDGRVHRTDNLPPGFIPGKPVGLFVTATNERVFVEGESGVRARIAGTTLCPPGEWRYL